MATLQTARQSSAFTAKSRLKQVIRERGEQPAIAPNPVSNENILETFTPQFTVPQAAPKAANRYADRLSELEQRQLLLQTVAVYGGWHLVSVQNRPESDVLVAYLLRNRDDSDPTDAIREGRAMQIIMDAVGDMKVQHPRNGQQPTWLRWLMKLIAVFSD